jgi:magnesium chelatase family protein
VISYPARFTLVGAMNPCPCGYYGDGTRPCTCSPADIARYRSRLSGPLLDRIDLHHTVSRVPLNALGEACAGETSTHVRTRVEAARGRQRTRFAGRAGVTCNAQASGRELLGNLTSEARQLIHAAAESLSLSARAYNRVVKVSRTISDLAGDARIEAAHVAEALRFR